MDKIKTLYASSLKKGSGATTGLEKLPVILCILEDVRVFYEESLVHEIQPG